MYQQSGNIIFAERSAKNSYLGWPHALQQSGNASVVTLLAEKARAQQKEKQVCYDYVLTWILTKTELCLDVVNVNKFLTMDDSIYKEKYQKYKLRVKLWEKDFKKKHNRVPSKVIRIKNFPELQQ